MAHPQPPEDPTRKPMDLPTVCEHCRATTPGRLWRGGVCPRCGGLATPAPEGKGER